MIRAEVVIWKFGVSITNFLLLQFVIGGIVPIKIFLVLTFDKRSTNCPKVALS